MSTCCKCNKPVVTGDKVRVFYAGGWSHVITVTEGYHQRIAEQPYCFFKRAHEHCYDEYQQLKPSLELQSERDTRRY